MSKQVIVELDDATAAELESVASSRDRRRSDFVRQALRKALDAVHEQRMAAAYERQPDSEASFFDPAAWEPGRARRREKKRR